MKGYPLFLVNFIENLSYFTTNRYNLFSISFLNSDIFSYLYIFSARIWWSGFPYLMRNFDYFFGIAMIQKPPCKIFIPSVSCSKYGFNLFELRLLTPYWSWRYSLTKLEDCKFSNSDFKFPVVLYVVNPFLGAK